MNEIKKKKAKVKENILIELRNVGAKTRMFVEERKKFD